MSIDGREFAYLQAKNEILRTGYGWTILSRGQALRICLFPEFPEMSRWSMKGRREASGIRDCQEQRQRVDRLDLRDMKNRVVVPGCWKFESYCRGAGDGLDFLWSYETGHQFGRKCPQGNVFSRQPYLLSTLICQSESSRWRSTVRWRASRALIQTC